MMGVVVKRGRVKVLVRLTRRGVWKCPQEPTLAQALNATCPPDESPSSGAYGASAISKAAELLGGEPKYPRPRKGGLVY